MAAAFAASPNPYMLLTPDLRYAGMNQAYMQAVGVAKREDLIGKPIFDVFTAGDGAEAPESVRLLRASFEKVLDTGQPDHIALIRYAMPSGPDGAFEDRYWSATHTPVKNSSGELTYILQHTSDVTELELLRRQAGAAERPFVVSALDAIIGGDLLKRARIVQEDNRRLEIERSRLVEMFMQAPGFVAVLSGPNHQFQLFNEAYRRIAAYRDLKGKTVEEALPEVRDQGFIDMLDSVYQTGEPFQGRNVLVQIARPEGGAPIESYLDFIYQPIRDDSGSVVGIFVQGFDVSDAVLSAERQRLMIDELNHRVKNTLATVQSIAMQTARSHQDPQTFAESFQSRLVALSHTHDLLTRSHWEGADLRDILQHETVVHDEHRVVLNGPAVPLEPAAALSLGMIFHELATNAAKYGALAHEQGRVFIDWSVANQNDRTLTLVWREEGGPPVVVPDRRGFGTRLIERNIRHDLAGVVNLRYLTSGFTAEISFPLDRGRQFEPTA
nr:HWE histidine kinase domain-containing protein [Brevundimonas variabilis]